MEYDLSTLAGVVGVIWAMMEIIPIVLPSKAKAWVEADRTRAAIIVGLPIAVLSRLGLEFPIFATAMTWIGYAFEVIVAIALAGASHDKVLKPITARFLRKGEDK